MSTRVDLYATVHRGLRHALLDTQVRLGQLDPADADARAVLLSQLDDVLRLCSVHLEDEERFIHPALEARAPRASHAVHDDHEHHLAQLAHLRRLAATLVEQPGPDAKRALERAFDAFVADSLSHMRHEEEVLMPVLQATWSDAELHALLERLLASIAPADRQRFTRWMMTGLPGDLRTSWLREVQREAPPEAFRGTLALAQCLLEPRAFAALEAALG